jgi:hypothetical protein
VPIGAVIMRINAERPEHLAPAALRFSILGSIQLKGVLPF